MSNNYKVFIAAGGKGTRLFHRTIGTIPKSLIPMEGKPLISYQLKTLTDARIEDVTLYFDEIWQIELCKQYIDFGLLPKANYSFLLKEYGPNRHHFITMKDWAESFVNGSSDLIFSGGDLIFTNHFLAKVLGYNRMQNSSVLTKDKPTFINTPRLLTMKNRVTGIDRSKNATWTLNCFFLINNNALKNLSRATLRNTGKTVAFSESCLKENKNVYALWPDDKEFLNVNEEKDYQRAVRLIHNSELS